MSEQVGIAGAADHTPTLHNIERRYGADIQHPRLTIAEIDKLLASGGNYNAGDLLRQLRGALEENAELCSFTKNATLDAQVMDKTIEKAHERLTRIMHAGYRLYSKYDIDGTQARNKAALAAREGG